jgi:hypothetical protein
MEAETGWSFLRVAFLSNGYWKLLSLVIAVLIYFTIRADISHVRVITIPVETEFEPGEGGAAIESAEPRSLQVTVRGSYSEVSQLVASTVRCVVRPKQKKNTVVDTVEVEVGSSNLRGVRGVRVAKIEPNVVVVKFDVPMTLRLAVASPATEGKARGRVELVCDQAYAVVKGSRRLLSPLDAEKVQIQTEPINVDGRSQTFSTRVRLLPPGMAVNALVEPPEMSVNVVILNEKATAKIERVPVIVSQPYATRSRWRVEPEWVDVELTGRSEVVKAVTFDQVMASVNGNIPLTPNTSNEVPVMVHVQQGVSVDEVTALPATVKLIPLIQLPADAQPNGP